jgi:hypothetical protein
MSASKLVSFVITHHFLIVIISIKDQELVQRRNSRAGFLSPAIRFLNKLRNAARESENLKDAVEGTVGHSVACTDCDDPVHPIVLRGAGFEHGTHPEVIAVGVDGLAFVEFFDHAGWTSTQALIRHDDQGAVCRLQYKADIQLNAGVGANRLPVVAAHNFAR